MTRDESPGKCESLRRILAGVGFAVHIEQALRYYRITSEGSIRVELAASPELHRAHGDSGFLVGKRFFQPLPDESSTPLTSGYRMRILFFSKRQKLLEPFARTEKTPSSQGRTSKSFSRPAAAVQSDSEQPFLEPLPRCMSPPVHAGRLSTSGTRNPRSDICQTEQQELLERFGRLKSLSSAIDSKLRELQEEKAQAPR